MGKRITRCINCGELPIVEPNTIDINEDEQYEFVLKHKKPCYPTFVLESYQHTEQECIDDWNKFNVRKK